MTDEEAVDLARRRQASAQAIMNMIGDKRRLEPSEKARIQASFRGLKEALQADDKGLDRIRGKLSPCLKGLHAAVGGALCQISSLKWNGDPIRSNWFSGLYAARVDLGFYLSHHRDSIEDEHGLDDCD